MSSLQIKEFNGMEQNVENYKKCSGDEKTNTKKLWKKLMLYKFIIIGTAWNIYYYSISDIILQYYIREVDFGEQTWIGYTSFEAVYTACNIYFIHLFVTIISFKLYLFCLKVICLCFKHFLQFLVACMLFLSFLHSQRVL